jgi:glutathione S-transferase
MKMPASMKLHWSPRSPFVRKVMVLAHEVGLADRIECVRSVVAMKKPNAELMRDNPLSKLPTLIVDGREALFDSVVICEYLDSLHGGTPMFPHAGPEKFRALRWHALGDGLLDLLILWRNERERPPVQQSPELLAAFEQKFNATMHLIDREAKELGAAPFGIGQIAIGCALGYIDFRFGDLRWRDAHAESASWFDAFARRPSVIRTHPDLD